MPTRCPETVTITVPVDGTDVELRCDIWTLDPDGRHQGDHTVQLPPAMGGEHTWPNTNPLPDDAA